MTSYPAVWTEQETLDLVRSGLSLARYGDGEFNLCRGLGIPSQSPDASLCARLRGILHQSGACLVGIPNLKSKTPKAVFWGKYHAVSDLLAERTYGSAFVTRPDSAPWINTPEYWKAIASLWVGQNVTLVRGSERSLTRADLGAARGVTEIIAPKVNAWAAYDDLIERIGTPERVLLCLGPTATVMAVDLCVKGVHAIDLGHVGMFWKKHQRGEPMVVTAKDKAS